MAQVPDRFDIRQGNFQNDALQALKRDGAIILTHVIPSSSLSSWSERAASIPHLLWPPKELLLEKHQASAVHVEQDGLSGLKGKQLLPHSDGYVWGDSYPDIVILLCEQPDGGGGSTDKTTTETDEEQEIEHGENYLIDGEDVMKHLDGSVIDTLTRVPVDHTERSEGGMANGAVSVVPVLRRCHSIGSSPCWWNRVNVSEHQSQKSRLCWRRMIQNDVAFGRKQASGDEYISLWMALDNEEKKTTEQALLALDGAIFDVSKESKRFKLQSGEALIVDNFRMLHARQGYSNVTGSNDVDEMDRRMWRVWSWTDGSFGLPPDVKGDIPANLADAEKALAKK